MGAQALRRVLLARRQAEQVVREERPETSHRPDTARGTPAARHWRFVCTSGIASPPRSRRAIRRRPRPGPPSYAENRRARPARWAAPSAHRSIGKTPNPSLRRWTPRDPTPPCDRRPALGQGDAGDHRGAVAEQDTISRISPPVPGEGLSLRSHHSALKASSGRLKTVAARHPMAAARRFPAVLGRSILQADSKPLRAGSSDPCFRTGKAGP